MLEARHSGTGARRHGRAWAGVVAVSVPLCLPAAVPLAAQELYPTSFTVASHAVLDSVRRLGIDVVEYAPAETGGGLRVVAVLGADEERALAARGVTTQRVVLSAAARLLESRRIALGARAFTVFRDYDDSTRGINAWLRAFAAARPGVTLDSIGATVEGRPLLVAKIGAADDTPARPNVFFVATYHAREWASTEMALRLLAWLADSLAATPAGAALLAARDVWVMPVANPDGYQYTFSTTRLWRKNRRPNGNGSYGVDLNRNHAGFFGRDDAGSSPMPGSGTYRGTAPESEPETQAIAAFHRAHRPDAAVSYHTYAGAILYPWGHENGALAPDQPLFRALAGTALAPAIPDRLPGSTRARYSAGPGWQLYPTNGDYNDWAYAEFRTAAFTVELTAGCCDGGAWYGFEFPDEEAMLAQLFRDNLAFALGVLEGAGSLEAATGPGGPALPQFEALWPAVRVLVPNAEVSATVQLALDTGVLRTVAVTSDWEGRGRVFTRLVGAASGSSGARAARAGSDAGSPDLVREALARAGAESESMAWSGFTRAPGGAEGSWHWWTDGACAGTPCAAPVLASPRIGVAGRSGLMLHFWTQHSGSLFASAKRGVVELRADRGAWVPVAEVTGSAPAWYPLVVPLEGAAGADSIELRWVADGMGWKIDAITLTAPGGGLFTAGRSATEPAIEVSQNPVRSGSVTLRWAPAGSGPAQVFIYSLFGTPVAGATLLPDPGRWMWDVRTRGLPVANGAYIVVVTRGDGRRIRRRLIVAH